MSENSRRDAIQVLGIAPERIVAIHPGVAPRFFDVPVSEVNALQTKLRTHAALCV